MAQNSERARAPLKNRGGGGEGERPDQVADASGSESIFIVIGRPKDQSAVRRPRMAPPHKRQAHGRAPNHAVPIALARTVKRVSSGL